MKALYIHIPFCNKICTYCDFYKRVAKENLKDKYVEYLLKELEMRKDLVSEIETIYIGGGTPSSLKVSTLETLFKGLKKYINFSKVKEFTFEINPTDVNLPLIQVLNEYKVNRVSLGVQSLKRKKLKFLGRDHRKGDIKKAIKLLQDNGITNINADVIFGTPNEKVKSVLKDVRKLNKYGVKHISTYSLQLEEKTVLYKLFKENKFVPIDQDLDADIFKAIVAELNELGYVHYEVSNFAKGEEFKSAHNLTYWNNEHYLGLGTAASYYIGDYRYTNINNMDKYFEAIDNNEFCYLEENDLVLGEKMFDEVVLGFRKLEGISVSKFQEKFEKDIYEVYPVLNELIEKGDIISEGDILRVPEEKIFILNSILIKFLG